MSIYRRALVGMLSLTLSTVSVIGLWMVWYSFAVTDGQGQSFGDTFTLFWPLFFGVPIGAMLYYNVLSGLFEVRRTGK